MPLTAHQARSVLRRNAIVENNTLATLRREVDVVIYRAAEKRQTRVTHRVPPFVFGLPVFDQRLMVVRLHESLTSDGYKVRLGGPTTLIIDFTPTPKVTRKKRVSAFQQLKALNAQGTLNRALS